MKNLIGKIVEVIVSKNGKIGCKNLKVCKANSRSMLFIEVDKVNRINTFRKFYVKNVEKVGTKTDGGTFVLIEDGIMPDKWESSWDEINTNPVKMSPYTRKHFSRHSKGWAPSLPSTTNSRAGFPMV